MTTKVVLGGLNLTSVDDFGCSWRTLAPIVGWDGPPGSTVMTTQKTRQHGGWLGPAPKLTPRTIDLNGIVTAPSVDALEDALDRLNAAADLNGSTLKVTRGDSARHATVYPDVDGFDHEEVTDVTSQWSVGLLAPDPRKYGTAQTFTSKLPHSSGGLSWPAGWPVRWTGVVTSGVIHIDNPGNIDTPLTVRIDGPVSGPRIRHLGSSSEVTLATDYTLPDGSWLDIDMENRTILEGGTASRAGFITSRGWFTLDPGANDLIFDADSYNSSALLTITFSPAYK